MGLFSNEPQILNAVSPEQILAFFKEQGFTAEAATTSQGKPYLRFKVDGFTSCIYFYSESTAQSGSFESLQFSAAFRDKITIEDANRWNRERRFIKVYADADGELMFEQDLSLNGGVTKDYLLERITDWRSRFTTVLRFFDK